MRALFFMNSFSGGGAEKVCLNLASQLHKFGIESDFVTIYNRNPDFDIPDYIHAFSLGIDDKPLACFRIVKAIPKVNRFISGRQYVLITAHVQPSHFLASISKVRKKCLYVIHMGSHRAEESRSWFYVMSLKLFLRGKKIITVSKGIEAELIKEYSILPENITTIYNPCAAATLKSKPEVSSPHVRPYILVMGRLVEQKNPLLALELYDKGQFYRSYDLIYLGKGSLEHELKTRIADYHLEDNVFLAGFQKNPEQWLKNAALLLSCSRQEGFPMNLAEALICGTPVVSADCPHGPKEILTGELARFLIYPEKRFNESISVIASALESYPEITDTYYEKLDDELITQMYLKTWEDAFGD